MHLWLSLPADVESGAVRSLQQDKEVILTDGGYEVRNTRWSSPLKSWHVSYGTSLAADVIHAAVEQMWLNTNGGVDTFNFTDPKSAAVSRVRFDEQLQFTNQDGPLYHLDTFTLREVRDVSPIPTVAPAITGTLTVGSTLSVSNGTWSGSPTSYAYQWLRDGVVIGGATAATYTLVSGDHAHMIGCAVTATDVYGGQTVTYAAAVGPVV